LLKNVVFLGKIVAVWHYPDVNTSHTAQNINVNLWALEIV